MQIFRPPALESRLDSNARRGVQRCFIDRDALVVVVAFLQLHFYAPHGLLDACACVLRFLAQGHGVFFSLQFDAISAKTLSSAFAKDKSIEPDDRVSALKYKCQSIKDST